MNRPEDQLNWAIPIPQALPVDEPLPVADIVEPLPEVNEVLTVSSAELLSDVPPVLAVEPLEYVDAVELASPRAHRGFAIFAWLVIVGLVAFVFFMNHVWPSISSWVRPRWQELVQSIRGEPRPLDAAPGANGPGMPAKNGGDEEPDDVEARFAEADLELAVFKMQARYLVGWYNLYKDQRFADEARKLLTGSADQRLRAIVVVGEVGGPNEAVQELERLGRDTSLTPSQRELKNVLLQLYRDYENNRFHAPSLDEEDRELLKDELDWFGELALAPAKTPDVKEREAVLKPAQATAIGFVGFVGGLGLFGLIGLCGLIIFSIYLLSGWLRRAFGRPGPYGGIYAETFALWMVAFLLMQFTLGYLFEAEESVFDFVRDFRDWLSASGMDRYRLLLLGLLELSTLLVVFWPVLRGVPGREVRQDFGLNWGRRPWAEPFIGVGCYIMSLPLMFVGVLIMLILMLLFGRFPGLGGAELLLAEQKIKNHPMVEFVTQAKEDWTILLQLCFLAAVVAPIVEEIMFRGVLYRQVRDMTGGLGFVMSLLLSGTVASFIFAVIHPQDPLAFPVLMSLAYGFTLAREWRGSVVPGMFMHGLHNGMIMVLLTLMLTM